MRDLRFSLFRVKLRKVERGGRGVLLRVSAGSENSSLK